VPFVATESIGESLGLTAADIQARLQRRQVTPDRTGPQPAGPIGGARRAARGPRLTTSHPEAEGTADGTRASVGPGPQAGAAVTGLAASVLRVVSYKVYCISLCRGHGRLCDRV
jgi:hypothetical protein